MAGAGDQLPISVDEAGAMFGDLAASSGLLLAISGGPDSTALLWLAARWRRASKAKLIAVTVDHGLRKEGKREAAAVGKLAKKLGVPHRVVKWTGAKPKSGIQQAARKARYALLTAVAKKVGASHILTAHTLDDQAETVLMRMARGSGIGGLGGMAPKSRLGSRLDGLTLMRPFLDVPKSRLIATCKAAKVAYSNDPSNIDPKFTRARLRPLMALLAAEGLDARRLSGLARRLRRADAAIEAAADKAAPKTEADATTLPAGVFAGQPAEVALRVLGRAVSRHATEGPVELGKLEALLAALLPIARESAKAPFRRTLAGALVTVAEGELRIETAPPRRSPQSLTKRRAATPNRRKTR
jgi:tRNA(Ile)-lysidine synthase